MERYKARLVAKGYTQIEGIDYTETFAPVAKMVTVRALLAIASVRNWPIHQLDVNNAFLHGDLLEEVYMDPPPGYSKLRQSKQVCKLNKSLYGLKQASRQWFAKLTSALLSADYTQSKADYSLFFSHTSTACTLVIVYVDDILVSGSSDKEISRLKLMLDDAFTINDLGQIKYYLGLEVSRSPQGIFVHQQKYILDLLSAFDVTDSKPFTIPMEQHLKLHDTTSDTMLNASTYRCLIGKLQYLTMSRPDISYTVNHLSQFLQTPCHDHMKAAIHVLRYLKGSVGMGLFFLLLVI